MTSYLKRGVNPFTKAEFLLFDWDSLRASATAENAMPELRAKVVDGPADDALGEIFLRQADGSPQWVAEIHAEPAGLPVSAETVVVEVEMREQKLRPGIGHCTVRLGKVTGKGDRSIVRAGAASTVCVGGVGRWLQVDERVPAYFKSGAYLVDAACVGTLERAGLRSDVFTQMDHGGDPAEVGRTLESAGVAPAELLTQIGDWTHLLHLEGGPELRLPLGARMHILVLRSHLESGKVGDAIRGGCVIELS